ncbi:MAG: flagellar motor switch protein FliN [Fretibacterium sp.]|nr:flagellar motor switch protein FliN [Fretibacterium sp.]
MDDGLLSQDEINALLSGGGDLGGDEDSELSSRDNELLNKVADIFSNAENSVIGMLSGKGIEITLDDAEVLTQEQFREKVPDVPPFLFSATFGGFDDAPLTIAVEQRGALTLADLMMGGGGTDLPEPSDLYWNAAQEGLSQVVGSAFTSLSGLLSGRRLMPENTGSAVGEDGWRLFATQPDDAKVWVSGANIQIEGLQPFRMWTALPLDSAASLAGLIRDVEDGASKQSAAAPPSMGSGASFGGQQPGPVVDVRPAAFQPLGGGGGGGPASPIDMIADIPVRVTVELGKTRKSVSEILALTNGAVIELDKMAGEPVDILVNGKLIAKGEVVVIDENFGVRITDIMGVGNARAAS